MFVIFFLLALAVQLFCVFWCRRRRRFSRETSSATPSDIITLHRPSSTPSPAPSKELLYFLYCKKQPSPVEPAGAVPSPAPRYPTDISRKSNSAAAGTDAATRWMGMYDPSSLLLMRTTKAADKKTKKEEESSSSSAATDDLERGVAVLRETTTPFSTPCASPPFYTPLSSPLAERKSGARDPAT
ncbi:hypothetical protein ACLOJK_006003 [Asimina triloba]